MQQVGPLLQVDLAGQAAIAVVEADDAKTPLDQPLAEGIGPGDELHAQSHDENDGRIGGLAERFVLD